MEKQSNEDGSMELITERVSDCASTLVSPISFFKRMPGGGTVYTRGKIMDGQEEAITVRDVL